MKYLQLLTLAAFSLFCACQNSSTPTEKPEETTTTPTESPNKAAYDELMATYNAMTPKIEALEQIANGIKTQGRNLTGSEINKVNDIENFVARFNIVKARIFPFEKMEQMNTNVSMYKLLNTELQKLENSRQELEARINAE